MIADFMMWFEERAEERIPGPKSGPELKKGEDWVRTYPTARSILDLYRDTEPETDPVTTSPELLAVREALNTAIAPQF